MTETEWLRWKDPVPMLWLLEDQVSERKLRLFSVACCRRIWELFQEPACCLAIETSERYADGIASLTELRNALETSWPAPPSSWFSRVFADPRDGWRGQAVEIAWQTAHPTLDARRVAQLTLDILQAIKLFPYRWDSWFGWGQEPKAQAALLRHFFYNPFRPFVPPPSWPSIVTALAIALYNGEDCHYALADALMEAGYGELAEHFQDAGHPKGCWAMDAILGKQ